MIIYIFLVWNTRMDVRYGTIASTTDPRNFAAYIKRSAHSSRVRTLYDMGTDSLRVKLIDVTTTKPSVAAIRKSWTKTMSDFGFNMAQRSRLDLSVELDITREDVIERSLTLDALEHDYRQMMPDYLVHRLSVTE